MKTLAIVSAVLAILVLPGVVAAADGGALRVTVLSGANEVPSADPDGTGFATIRLNYGQGQVCWEVSFENIDAPTAAHIHFGPPGVNGPILIPLSPIASGCASAPPVLIRAIIQTPGVFYVNVHNAAFPGGAIRGQLGNAGQAG